jgi:hypothetical protein
VRAGACVFRFRSGDKGDQACAHTRVERAASPPARGARARRKARTPIGAFRERECSPLPSLALSTPPLVSALYLARRRRLGQQDAAHRLGGRGQLLDEDTGVKREGEQWKRVSKLKRTGETARHAATRGQPAATYRSSRGMSFFRPDMAEQRGCEQREHRGGDGRRKKCGRGRLGGAVCTERCADAGLSESPAS